MTKWQNRRCEDCAEILGSDLYRGLSPKEAAKRSNEKKNILFSPPAKDSAYYGKKVFLGFLPILLLVTALAMLMTEETVAGYLLLGALAFSLCVLFFAFRKAGEVMEEASRQGQPAVKAVRNGVLYLIPLEELAEGDLILLAQGDLVPADCRLVQSDALVVQESGITSRRYAEKNADCLASGAELLDSPNMIFAGTAVVQGSCRALVCRVGQETHLATVMEKREDGFEKTSLPMQLKKLSAILTAALIGLIFFATFWGFFPAAPADFLSNFLLACAFAASTMAEFYATFAYITAGNALYSSRNGIKGALYQRNEALENASRVDRVFVTPALFCVPDSKKLVLLADPFHGGAKEGEKASLPLKHLLRDGALALGEWYGASPLAKGWQNGDETLQHCVRRFRDKGDYTLQGASDEAKYPFVGCGVTSSGIRFGLILRGETPVLTVMAPADRLLSYGGYAYREGKILPLTEEREQAVLSNSRRLARGEKNSLREVLAIAIAVADRLPDGRIDEAFLDQTLSHGLVLEGFFVFEEAMHAESMDALARAREQKLAVSLFAAESELPLCEKLGFSSIQAPKMGEASEAAFPEDTVRAFQEGKNTLHISCSRKEKLRLIRLAKEMEQTVAFLGEDLSEYAHMKEADLAVSIGDRLDEGRSIPVANTATASRYTDALRLSSDLTVSYPSHNGGGFAALQAAFLRAGSFFYNMRAILCYLATALGMKLVLTLVSLFVSTAPVSAEELVLSGLVYDLGAVIALLLRGIPRRAKDLSEKEIFRSLPASLLTGVLLGVFVAVVALTSASVSELFVPAAILAVSLMTLLSQYLTDRVKPFGFGAIFLFGSVLLLTALVLVDSGDMLWLLAAVFPFLTQVLDGGIRRRLREKGKRRDRWKNRSKG